MSSCCSPSNLVQLIEINLNIEKEFENVFWTKWSCGNMMKTRQLFHSDLLLLITVIFMI
jgi:hypothetical protein